MTRQVFLRRVALGASIGILASLPLAAAWGGASRWQSDSVFSAALAWLGGQPGFAARGIISSK